MVGGGKAIVPKALQDLQQHGVERPIVFTIEPLFSSTNQLVLPHIQEVSGVFTDLPPHAPDTAIEAALARCIRTGARSIIAYGGGSGLYAAKAASHFHSIRQR